jgi:uncharacterized peroxidase-related enzyme
LARAIAADYRTAELVAADRAMLDYVAKLTRAPASVESGDLDELRRHGFDDAAIHDIVQAASLFNYYNRLADGLGIDPEPDWQAAAANDS